MDMSQIPAVVGQIIDTIASKLDVPTQRLLDITVSGTRVEGIILLVFAVTKFVIAASITIKCSKIPKEKIKEWNDSVIERYPDRKWGGFFLAIIIGTLASVFAYYGALMAFAPEYSLLKMILKF